MRISFSPGINDMFDAPKISVIVPFYNAAATLARCLQSLLRSGYQNFEIIAVDDRSTDNSAAIASHYSVRLVQMIRRSGAAAARNIAVAAAEGDILFFVDADVLVPPGVLEKISSCFEGEPALDALFGSYTIFPAAENFTSIYKNLVHHHTHLTSEKHASTFWCGCGAMRRRAFEKAKGFRESYTASSVEDIDLGYRLTKTGAQIRLVPEIRVVHAKKYQLWSLIRSDVLDRAIPWTKLMARENIFKFDLNLKLSNIISGILLAVFLPLALISVWLLPELFAYFLGVVAAFYFILNFRIWWYVCRIKGFFFSLLFLLMYLITYLYSVFGFAIGFFSYLLEGAGGAKNKA